MTLTKSMKKDIVKHILEGVFDLAADSELHRALSQNNLFTPESMLSFPDDGYDNWNRSTVAQARAQNVDDVLDSTYVPTTKEEIELFEEKKKFMYAVFKKTLLTDKGKALVRAYQKTYDAQAIYKKLPDYALQSTKATMNATALLSYITIANISDDK